MGANAHLFVTLRQLLNFASTVFSASITIRTAVVRAL
jgi:hypothetical protein